jgi:hypothetical protein
MQALRFSSFAFAAALIALTNEACADAHRSSAVRAAFERGYPCPPNGNRRGPCPGFVVDHVVPLCAGGRDDTDNMRWQATADALAKDAWERRLCRSLPSRGG